jgi:hypothetical protein
MGEDQKTALAVSFDLHLAKPITLEELQDALKLGCFQINSTREAEPLSFIRLTELFA